VTLTKKFQPKTRHEIEAFAEEDLLGDLQVALERALAERGMTKTQFARRMGVSKARVTQILGDGANLTVGSLARAFLALNVKCTVEYDKAGSFHWVLRGLAEPEAKPTEAQRWAGLSIVSGQNWATDTWRQTREGLVGTNENGRFEQAA
jgi:transcriptional regulator with XRE-family HTH domain